MSDRAAVNEELRILKALRKEAGDLWFNERLRWQTGSGAGYARYSDKSSRSLAGQVAERAIGAGASWSDVEVAIKRVAADPRGSPWAVFDQALIERSNRADEARIERRRQEDAEAIEDPVRAAEVARMVRMVAEHFARPWNEADDRVERQKRSDDSVFLSHRERGRSFCKCGTCVTVRARYVSRHQDGLPT